MTVPPTLAILNIGLLELFMIVVVAIMLFGGDLPDVARKAGRLLGRLRSTVDDLRRYVDAPPELRDVPRQIEQDLEAAARDGEEGGGQNTETPRREDQAPAEPADDASGNESDGEHPAPDPGQDPDHSAEHHGSEPPRDPSLPPENAASGDPDLGAPADGGGDMGGQADGDPHAAGH